MPLASRLGIIGLILILAASWNPVMAAEKEDTISFEFRQAFALDILKIIAQRGGRNLMIGSKAAHRQVTVRFTDISIAAALAGVASAAEVQQCQIGSITVFYDPAEARTIPVPTSPGTPPASSSLISMDFRDADIRDLLHLVALKTGLTIIPEKSVRGMLSCHLTNVDGADVVQAAAVAAGCEFGRDGSALLVADPGRVDALRTPNESGNGTATVDLAVADLDLRFAMSLAALACGRDFLATPEVRGNIRLEFHGLPEAQLMHLLAGSQGFNASRFGTLWVLSSPVQMAGFASPPLWPLSQTTPLGPSSDTQAASASPTNSLTNTCDHPENHRSVDGKPPAEPLINLEFRDAYVRDILTLASRRGNKPVRFPAAISSRLAIRLMAVPVSQAIRLISRVCGFSCKEDRNGMFIDDGAGTNSMITIEPDICPSCPRDPFAPPKNVADSERVAAEISVGGGPLQGGGAIKILATARGPAGSYALAVAGGALKTLEPGSELFDRQIVNRIGTDSVEFVDKVSRAQFKVQLGH